MQALQTTRMERGYVLAQNAEIKRISDNEWNVPSQSGNGSYAVFVDNGKFECSCPDYHYRVSCGIVDDKFCKHIWCLSFYLALRKRVESDVKDIAKLSTPTLCKFCNSTSIIKYGFKGKRVKKQAYFCKDCNRKFVKVESGFERLQNEPRIISLMLSMYYKNMSLRSIADTLESTYSIKIAHKTVHNYIRRYEKLLTEYVSTLKPEFSGKVNIDEMYIRVKGEMKYLFNALDPDTRYLLASVLSQKKDYKGARAVMQQVKKVVGHDKKAQPIRQITTDKLRSYERAHFSEFKGDTMTKDRNPPEHIVANKANGIRINNVVERLHNTLRERENVYRGLKSDDTPIINMQTIHYNFVRKHRGLKMADSSFLTPAEMAGVDKDLGRDKWLGLIKKAKQLQTY